MSERRDSIIYLTVLHNNVRFLLTLVFTYKAQAGALADDNGKDSSCDALNGDQRLIKQLIKVRNTKCIISYFVFILKSTVLFFLPLHPASKELPSWSNLQDVCLCVQDQAQC